MNAPIRRPLKGKIVSGEILPPDDVLIVSAAMHPLRTAHQPVLVPAGSSIKEIVTACEKDGGFSRIGKGWYVEIDGQAVPEEWWGRVRVRAGTHVFVKAVARGFVVPLIMTALTSVFPILGTNALLGAIVAAGIGLLAQLVMSALFPPASTKDEKAKTIYSIAASRNEVAKWQPVPSILGRVRVAPKYAGSPWTRFSGNSQYVNMLFCWGYGPLSVEDIKIGETPITDYEDVEIETIYGYPDDPAISLYTEQPVQEDLTIVVKQKSGAIVRDTAEGAKSVQVDFVAPNGIFRQNSEGKRQSKTVEIKLEIKPADAADTAYTLWENVVLQGDKANPIRVTKRLSVAEGQYTVRLTRITGDKDDEPEWQAGVNWTALRIFRKANAYDFPLPLTMTAIRIKASDQLNGTPDNVNGIVTTRARSWNGSAWVADTKAAPVTTRNCGDLVRHVLQGPANNQPMADSKIDLASIQAFATRCRVKGFEFNMNRDFKSSVWETLRDVCAAGRAVPLHRDGKWSVAWEESNANVVQMFTPRNSWNLRRRQEYRNLPHALRVKFQNEDKGWIEDERLVYADGYSKANATLVEQAEFPGVTDKGMIYKHGRYRLAEGKLRPATYTLCVDAEHLVCTRGDRVRIAHDVLMNTLATGRVRAVSGQTITLDEPVVMEAGKSYAIRFRLANGTQILRSVVTNPGERTVIALVGSGTVPSASSNKSSGDLWAFGPSGQDSGVYRVKAIRMLDDLAAEMEMVDDAPEIEAADDGAIPEYDSGLVIPPDLRQFAPYDLSVAESIEVRGGAALYVTNLLFREVTGVNAGRFLVEAINGAGRVVRRETAERVARFENLDADIWTFKVQSIYPDRRSKWSQPFVVQLIAENTVPPDPEDFAINPIGDTATLTWAETLLPISKSEIRYTPATTGATWTSAVPLILNARGGSAPTAFQSGTYLIKHISYGGIYSANPQLVIVTNAGEALRNVVEEFFEISPFNGEHAGTTNAPAGLELASAFDVFSVDDIFAVEDVFLGDEGFQARGVYYPPEVIDLGEVFTSRVSADLMAEGINYADNIFAYPDVFALANVFAVEPDQWSVEAQISTTPNDPVAVITRAGPATYYDAQGVLRTAAANVARYDHDPITHEPLGLLVEEARTNLFRFSNDFTQTPWSKSRVNLTPAFAIGPDGTMSATLMVENTESNTHQIAWSVGNPADTKSVQGLHVKKAPGGRRFIRLWTGNFANQSQRSQIDFDLDAGTGVISGAPLATAEVFVQRLADGWWRISPVMVQNGMGTASLTLSLLDDNKASNYTGDGTSGVLIYGGQWENAGSPSSYIPTNGANVTRPADIVVSQPTWADWSRLVVGDYTARAFKFRLVLTRTEESYAVTPRVSLFHATVDMPDRDIPGKDIAVPTAGLRVPFNPPFRQVRGLARNDQNMATGDYAQVTALDQTGFNIRYFNASGTPVARSLDFVAKGYGRKVN